MNNYCSNNMCYRNYQIPNSSNNSNYRNSTSPIYNSTNELYNSNYIPSNVYMSPTPTGDDRFFIAPFLVGGLAGTALGYGIANNNNSNGGYYMPPPPIYYYPQPAPYTYNNYYY